MKLNDNGSNTYQNVKVLTVSQFDAAVKIGVAGGDADSGYSALHTDLETKSLGPGIFWSSAQPSKTNKLYTNYNSPIWTSLDNMMDHCENIGATCPIYIGGVPNWAVEGAKSKTGLICDENFDGVEDSSARYAFPIDTADHQDLADFVAAVVERFDGDGVSDSPSGAKATFINILNEPDLGTAFEVYPTDTPGNNNIPDHLEGDGKASCEDPKYWTTSSYKDNYKNSSGQTVYVDDVNGNGIIDAKDYADLYWKIHTTVNPNFDANGKRIINMPTNFGRLAMDFAHHQGALPSNYRAAFLANILSYGYGGNGERPYSMMDIHYYETDDYYNAWHDSIYNVGGIRGKLETIKELMQSNGGVKPVSFTEFGSPAAVGNAAEEELQAQRMWKMTAQAYSTGIVKQLQWFNLQSSPTGYFSTLSLAIQDASQPGGYRKRPVFTAFKILQQELTSGASKEWRFASLNTDHDCGERYVFQNEKDFPDVRKEITWASNRKPAGSIPPCGSTFSPMYEATQVVIRKKDGSTVVIDDGETGATPDLDPDAGQIKFTVTSDPVIVKY